MRACGSGAVPALCDWCLSAEGTAGLRSAEGSRPPGGGEEGWRAASTGPVCRRVPEPPEAGEARSSRGPVQEPAPTPRAQTSTPQDRLLPPRARATPLLQPRRPAQTPPGPSIMIPYKKPQAPLEPGGQLRVGTGGCHGRVMEELGVLGPLPSATRLLSILAATAEL